jgi:hypothetical protein
MDPDPERSGPVKEMTPMTNTATLVPAKGLTDLLSSVLPLAAKADRVPALNAVQLRVLGDYLVATATDRYVAGSARTFLAPDGSTAEWTALVSAADVKAVLVDVKKLRAPSIVELTVDAPTTLTIGYAGSSRTVRLVDAGYPKVQGIIAAGLASAQKRTKAFGLNPEFFGRFAAAAKVDKRLVVDCWMDDHSDRVVITCGDDFVGLIMGCRINIDQDDTSRGRVGIGWDDLLAGRAVVKAVAETATETPAAVA